MKVVTRINRVVEVKEFDVVLINQDNQIKPAIIIANHGGIPLVKTLDGYWLIVPKVISVLIDDPIPFQGESYHSPEITESDSYGLEGRF